MSIHMMAYLKTCTITDTEALVLVSRSSMPIGGLIWRVYMMAKKLKAYWRIYMMAKMLNAYWRTDMEDVYDGRLKYHNLFLTIFSVPSELRLLRLLVMPSISFFTFRAVFNRLWSIVDMYPVLFFFRSRFATSG